MHLKNDYGILSQMLTLDHVGFKRENRWLLRDATLTLAPHALTVVVGPNGAGKTTFLHLLAGLCTPTVGHITLNCYNLRNLNRRELARQMTLVPQNTYNQFAFTALDLVLMGRNPYLKHFQRETPKDYACAENAMQQMDVLHLAHRSITTLSGGEQQRVLIARSLATEAPILLFDEPTAHLDIHHAFEILKLSQKLTHDGKTVIIASHDLNLAVRYADQLIVINQGQIIGCGPPSAVLTASLLAQTFRVKMKKLSDAAGQTFFLFQQID